MLESSSEEYILPTVSGRTAGFFRNDCFRGLFVFEFRKTLGGEFMLVLILICYFKSIIYKQIVMGRMYSSCGNHLRYTWYSDFAFTAQILKLSGTETMNKIVSFCTVFTFL